MPRRVENALHFTAYLPLYGRTPLPAPEHVVPVEKGLRLSHDAQIMLTEAPFTMQNVVSLADKYALPVYDVICWLESMRQVPTGTSARVLAVALAPDLWPPEQGM